MTAEPVAQPAHDRQPADESPSLPPEAASQRSAVGWGGGTRLGVLAGDRGPPDHPAPREINLVEGGRFGFGVAAEVLFSKYGLHVPLHRQQDSLAQLGWSPSRSTLGLIVTHSAELFFPLAELFRQRVLASDVLGTDDTPVTLLTPGRRRGAGKRVSGCIAGGKRRNTMCSRSPIAVRVTDRISSWRRSEES